MQRSREMGKAEDCLNGRSYRGKIPKHGQCHSLPITPQKIGNRCEEPLTPTANLKMLVSAAFGMANTEREGQQKRELFNDEDEEEYLEDSCSTVSDSIDEKQEDLPDGKKPLLGKDGIGNSRKLKSLGLLCKKFLSKYPPGSEGTIINLHDIAKELGVERRRIYDIGNVLESLEYVTKKGKNTYTWHGSARLVPTLMKLKALAEKIYSAKKDGDKIVHGTQDNDGSKSKTNEPPAWLQTGTTLKDDETEVDALSIVKQDDESCRRKNKSLGIFCQKLIMLFMVSKNNVIALDEAAKEVIEIGDDQKGRNDKTKVRRLYDIANILTSMGLIEKTPTYFGSRKAAFRWVGVQLDTLKPDTETIDKALIGEDSMPTKHSLFSQPCSIDSSRQASRSSVRKLEIRSFSAGNIYAKKRSKMPRTKSAATIVSRKRPSSEGIELEKDNDENKPKNCNEDMPEVNGDANGSAGNSLDGCRSNSMSNDWSGDANCQNLKGDSPVRKSKVESDTISPNERRFREEVRKLQQQFPDKFQNVDGLLSLLSAGNALHKSGDAETAGAEEKGSRCNLLKRIEEGNVIKVSDNGSSSTEAGCRKGSKPTQSSKDEFSNKALSMKSFKVIMDQLKDKDNALTLRLGIEQAQTIDNLVNVPLFKSAGKENNSGSQSWNCYPYNVTPSVQKASVGVQASLLDGVSPLKPFASASPSNKRKRSTEDSDRETSLDGGKSDNVKCISTCIPNGSMMSVKIPIYTATSAVNTTLSKCNVRQGSSCFLLEFKSPKTQTARHFGESLPLAANSKVVPAKDKANDVTPVTSPLQASHRESVPKAATKDNIIQMVPIAPMPFDMSADKENCEPINQPACLGSTSASGSTATRFFLPLQVLNGEAQRSSPPALLPKIRRDPFTEETPTRLELRESNQSKVQRMLQTLPKE